MQRVKCQTCDHYCCTSTGTAYSCHLKSQSKLKNVINNETTNYLWQGAFTSTYLHGVNSKDWSAAAVSNAPQLAIKLCNESCCSKERMMVGEPFPKQTSMDVSYLGVPWWWYRSSDRSVLKEVSRPRIEFVCLHYKSWYFLWMSNMEIWK